MRRSLTTAALTAALLSGCVTGPVAPPAAPVPIDVEDETLTTRLRVYEDEAAADSMTKIAEALLSEEERAVGAPDIVVVLDPTINAFALPGRIYLHTGLLSRVENEAQLAVVMARELSHLSRRHVVARPGVDARLDEALLRIAPSIIGTAPLDEGAEVMSHTAATILGKRLPRAYVAAIGGYGRDAEREADEAGLERVVRAGYDPKEAPKVFERLRRDAKNGGVMERFRLGNDAALAERQESMTTLVAGTFAYPAALTETTRDTPEFVAIATPIARENARLELRAGRFRAAQEQLDRVLAANPGDGLAFLYYGDWYRLRAQRARSVADRDEFARKALAAY